MVAVMGISCSSKRPTGMNDFAEVGPEDAVGSGENPTDHTFDIGVIYPDVENALQTEGIDITKVSIENGENLTKIWKKLLDDGNKKLYVTFHKLNNGNNVTVDNFKDLSYFDFDASGNMIYRNNQDSTGKNTTIKEFVKGVIVKIDNYNGSKDGYVIGGLYKTKDANNSSKQALKHQILHYKIGHNVPDGNYEVVYIHPQHSANNQYHDKNYDTVGFSYAFYGSYNDTTAKKTEFEKAIKPEDYKPLYNDMKYPVGVRDAPNYPTRFYRTK